MFKYTNKKRTKRRRMMAMKSEPEPYIPPQIFEDCRFYIHPHNINGSRQKVLRELIAKYGGTHTYVLDDETTHVLVGEGVTCGKLSRSLGGITLPSDIKVMIVSWLSASVRASRCLSPVGFEIPCSRRLRFDTSHYCVASASTATIGAADNESDASTSSCIIIDDDDDADAELPYLDADPEEASSYDDGKYDEETSCDDEWVILAGVRERYNSLNSEPLNTADIVNFEPSNTADNINSGPLNTADIVNSGPSNAADIVNSGPSNAADIVNSGPSNAPDTVNSGPSNATDIVNSGPSNTTGIVNSEPSTAAGINSEPSNTADIVNSGPSNTADIVNSEPSNTTDIVNFCTLNPCGTFSTTSISSSNLRSLEPPTDCKKRKLKDISPPSRPNTLAARLSRVRVRRIPEHLRVPGERAVIVDFNGETFSQPCSKNIDSEEIINNDSCVILNKMEKNNTDEKYKVTKKQDKALVVNKTVSENIQNADKSFDNQDNIALIHNSENVTHFEKQNTESNVEVSEDKSKKSVTIFSPNEQFDAESVNEVSQVVTMIVESVFEVAVNEKIINESVVEISKNAMENVDSAYETLKNENISTELVSDILLRVVEDVVKAETNSEIKTHKFESLNENCVKLSEKPNLQDTVKISKNESRIENKEIDTEDETPREKIETLQKNETFKNVLQENTLTKVVEIESAISELPVHVSPLPIISSVSPYPVQLFCSAAFDSPALDHLSVGRTKQEPVEFITADLNFKNYSDDQTKQESVEYITADINIPSNFESLDCEVVYNSNAASKVVYDKRSCKRPDITGPDIFFPFPVPKSSAHSHNSNNKGPSSLLSGASCNPNLEIIKKLQTRVD